MAVRPSIGRLSIPEAEALLSGLVAVNRLQIAQGAVPSGSAFSAALRAGQLRYIRRDPDEHWMTLREVWAAGGGDCEDLAAGFAAELQAQGHPHARVVLFQAKPGLWHAVTEIAPGLPWRDPSRTGGMRGPG